MLKKIITYFLILAVVLPVLAAAVPAGVNRAQAADPTKETSSDSAVSNPCEFHVIRETFVATVAPVLPFLYRNAGGSVWNCASYTIVYILYEFVLKIVIWIAGLASDLFNVSIQFSLTGEVFDADKNTMIKDGWTLVRDLLNLVFIFILLFAAISTILQYGGVEIKKVLPGLIIAALLVNFSLMITKMVIDASHIFAWEFYNQIDETNKEGLGNKEIFTNMQGSINVDRDFKKKNLANVFIAGFNPQKMLIESEMATTIEENGEKEFVRSPWEEVYEHARKAENDESILSTLWRMALIILLESALAIFAAFILLAGAIMFVARVVILWMVMIFSPLAFLGMILPSMEKYSKMWWGYLIGQSFFAPAFLFMFMLATKFINSKLVDNLLHVIPNDDSKIVLGLSMGEVVLIFFNFLIVGGIMMMCLIVAKQLGGKTAEFGIGGAHRVKGWALGAPGNALKYGLNNRMARWGWGQLADKTLDKEKGWGEKRWAKTLTSIPGVGIGLRKLGTMKKADEDKMRKAAEKYAGTLSTAGRESLEREIEGTKGVGGFVKRFAYTGPEGAFKPGKEGYEKIIAKKNAEKEEEDRVFKKRIELMGGEKDFLDKFADIKSGESEEIMRQKIDNAKQRAKSLIRQGDTSELDKLIEEKDKVEEEKNKIERENIVTKKRKLKLEIGGYEDSLKEARKSGDAKDIEFQEGLLLGSLTDADNLEKKLIEIATREKHRENLQKTVDKYDDKQRAKAGKPEDKKEKEAKIK